MALSGSFTKYFQGNASRFHMTTSWSATQNIANNTSTITAITTVRPEGAIVTNASKNGSITIAGNRKNFTFVLGSLGAGATKEVGRHTVTVSHASNGTGSAAISSTLDINIEYSGLNLGSLSTSGTATLDTIPRTSSFTIPSSFNVGSAFTVTITRANTSFTHEISLHDGSTALYWSGNNVATSGSPNVAANTLIARMSGVKSKVFTVRVDTFNGSTRIGSTSKTITANIPVSTFTTPNDFTMGEDFTVNITPTGSVLRHKVELLNGSTVLYASANNVPTSDDVSVSWGTMGLTCTNAMSKNYVIRVTTYNGSTAIGSNTRNIKGWVPSNIRPSLEHINAAETITEVSSTINAFIQGKSRVKIMIVNAKAGYGSWITNYIITGYGINHSSSSISEATSNILYSAGTLTYTATVTDARGQTYTWTRDIEVLPYIAPTLSDLSFRRTLPEKTEAPLGDNVTVRANVKVHSLIVNGVQKNSIKYQVQSSKSGGSYSDKVNTTSTSLTKSYSDVWVGYSVDHYYHFRVRVGDVFGFGSWFVGRVPTGVVTQQWGSRTTSFGKMIDKPQYNVQVGTGGIQSDGPIIDNSGNEVVGTNTMFHKITTTTPSGAGWENGIYIVVPPHFSGKFEVLDAKLQNANRVWLDANAFVRPNHTRLGISIEVPSGYTNLELRIIIMKI